MSIEVTWVWMHACLQGRMPKGHRCARDMCVCVCVSIRDKFLKPIDVTLSNPSQMEYHLCHTFFSAFVLNFHHRFNAFPGEIFQSCYLTTVTESYCSAWKIQKSKWVWWSATVCLVRSPYPTVDDRTKEGECVVHISIHLASNQIDPLFGFEWCKCVRDKMDVRLFHRAHIYWSTIYRFD